MKICPVVPTLFHLGRNDDANSLFPQLFHNCFYK